MTSTSCLCFSTCVRCCGIQERCHQIQAAETHSHTCAYEQTWISNHQPENNSRLNNLIWYYISQITCDWLLHATPAWWPSSRFFGPAKPPDPHYTSNWHTDRTERDDELYNTRDICLIIYSILAQTLQTLTHYSQLGWRRAAGSGVCRGVALGVSAVPILTLAGRRVHLWKIWPLSAFFHLHPFIRIHLTPSIFILHLLEWKKERDWHQTLSSAWFYLSLYRYKIHWTVESSSSPFSELVIHIWSALAESIVFTCLL